MLLSLAVIIARDRIESNPCLSERSAIAAYDFAGNPSLCIVPSNTIKFSCKLLVTESLPIIHVYENKGLGVVLSVYKTYYPISIPKTGSFLNL